MPRPSASNADHRVAESDKGERWQRVGAFVAARRQALGISGEKLAHALGYAHRSTIAEVEQGRRGISAARAYAWADALQLSRDAFFQFVTGDREHAPEEPGADDDELSRDERRLVALYRQLTPAQQREVRDRMHALVARGK